MSNKIITVKATAFYCKPNKLDDMSGKYQMDLGLLDQKTADAFKSLGIKLKFDTKNAEGSPDYKGFFVTPKSDVPIVPTDMEGNDLPSKLLIGNGSVVYAGLRIAPYTFQQRTGHKLVWLGLKVQTLVKYDPDAAARAKADQLLDSISGEGFVFGESSNASHSPTTNIASPEPNFEELFGDAQ